MTAGATTSRRWAKRGAAQARCETNLCVLGQIHCVNAIDKFSAGTLLLHAGGSPLGLKDSGDTRAQLGAEPPSIPATVRLTQSRAEHTDCMTHLDQIRDERILP